MLDNIKSEGIILKAVNFREIDKKIDILFPNGNLIQAIAFGAKKSKKRFGGNLEPYNLVKFELQKHKSFYVVKEALTKVIFFNLKKNLQTLKILFNITTLLTSKTLDIHKDVYKALLKLLFKLDEAKEKPIKYYLFFLIYFLKKEGFLSLPLCFTCGNENIEYIKIDEEAIIFYCSKCNLEKSLTNLSPESIIFFKTCISGDRKFLELSLKKNSYLEVEEVLLKYIQNHFQLNLEKINDENNITKANT
jgi:DNA repair protein RecO (recombination protein O)